jgi:hypothetical protein
MFVLAVLPPSIPAPEQADFLHSMTRLKPVDRPKAGAHKRSDAPHHAH